MGRPWKDLPPARDDSRRRLCNLHAQTSGVPWRWPLPLPRSPPPSDYQPPFRELACALPSPALIYGAVPTSGVPSGNATRQWIYSQTKRFVKTQHHARRTKVLSQLMYLCRLALVCPCCPDRLPPSAGLRKERLQKQPKVQGENVGC